MTLSDITIELLRYVSNIILPAAILVFLHCFYDPRYTWTKKKALYYCLAYLILTIIMCFVNIPTIIIWAVDFLILFHDYPKKKFRAFLRYFFFYFAFAYLTTGIAIVYNEITSDTPIFTYVASYYDGNLAFSEAMTQAQSLTPSDSLLYLTYALTIIYFGSIFCFLYFRCYKKNITMQCKFYEKTMIFVYPLLIVILLGILIFVGRTSLATLTILTTMSMLLALVIPMLTFGTRISRYYREQTVRQEDYMQAQLAHFTQYKQTQEETALFRHDIRNNLLCVSEMLASGKTEEATSYLQDLLKTSEALRQAYVSGDEMLDCIIGVKSSIMRESHIDFQLDGVLAGGLPWKPVDICAVFANAIDNAIEACLKLPESDRYIRMNIRSTAQYWFISVVNPTAEQVDTKQLFQKKGGYTSKTDKERHGIGTYKMRQTVEAYGGVLKAEAQDQAFILEIMIDKSSS